MKRFQPVPDLVAEEVEEEVILLDKRSAETFLLNGMGAVVFELCREGRSLEEMVEEITSVFPEPKEKVRSDVERFLEELAAKKLIEQREAVGPSA